MIKPNLNAPAKVDLTAKGAEDFAEGRKGLPLRPLRKIWRSLRLIHRSVSFNWVALKPISSKPTPAGQKP